MISSSVQKKKKKTTTKKTTKPAVEYCLSFWVFLT